MKCMTTTTLLLIACGVVTVLGNQDAQTQDIDLMKTVPTHPMGIALAQVSARRGRQAPAEAGKTGADAAPAAAAKGADAAAPAKDAGAAANNAAAAPAKGGAATEAAAGEAPVRGEYAKIAPFGKEDTSKELQDHAARTQDTLVDAVENAEVAEIKRAVFRALTRLRAASIKEFDTIARLETQAIDEYNDAHHYRGENPLAYLHDDEPAVGEDKYTSFH